MRAYFALAASSLMIGFAVPAAAQTPATVNWSGFYAGINGGYGSGTTATTNASSTTDGSLFGIPGTYTAPNNVFTGSDYSIDANGGFGGIQAGYNFVSGNLLAGFETDFDWADVTSRSRFLGSDQGPVYDTTGKLDWFGTVRGRVGVTADRLLFYGTAGLAYGHADGGLTVTPGTVQNPGVGGPFTASDSQTHVGYAVGAGVEAAMTQHVTLRLEYLYMDLGKRNYHFAFPDSNGSTTDSTEAITENLFRVGLNYRF
jgi:outer membrane immunogenic protein